MRRRVFVAPSCNFSKTYLVLFAVGFAFIWIALFNFPSEVTKNGDVVATKENNQPKEDSTIPPFITPVKARDAIAPAFNMDNPKAGETQLLIAQKAFEYFPPGSGATVDVGANVGGISFFFAKSGYKVHSFEALPQNCDQVKRHLSRVSERLDLHCNPVFDESGVKILMHTNWGNGQLKHGTLPKEIQSDTIVGTTTTISESVPHNEPFIFWKFDCEGFEYRALRGARSIFRETNNGPIFLFTEFSPKNIEYASGISPYEYLEELHQYGYELHLVDCSPTKVDGPKKEETCEDFGEHIPVEKCVKDGSIVKAIMENDEDEIAKYRIPYKEYKRIVDILIKLSKNGSCMIDLFWYNPRLHEEYQKVNQQ